MKGELPSETVNYDTKHCMKSVQIRSFFWSEAATVGVLHKKAYSFIKKGSSIAKPSKNTYLEK